MIPRNRKIVFVLAVEALAVFLFAGVRITAQETKQSTAPMAAVPDNPGKAAAPVQPIPYSHKKHLAQGLECKDCHTNADPGKKMEFPAASKCMQCHSTIAKDSPSIQKLAGFANSGAAIPWVRVYTVLPGVTWTHRKHLQAGVKCETCHGAVAQMDVMTEATSITSMFSCLHCHEMSKAKSTCETCHQSMTPSVGNKSPNN